MGELLAVLALVLFSCNALLVTVASPRLGQRIGFLIALCSNVVFGLLLLAGDLALRSSPLVLDWSALAKFAVGGLLTAYLGRRLFFRSIETIGAARATALAITNPMFALFFGWVFLHESLGPIDLALMAVVILGLELASRVRRHSPVYVGPPAGGAETEALEPPPRDSVATSGNRYLPRAEVALALLSALAYGGGNVVRSSGVREWNVPVLGILVGVVCAVLLYFVLDTSPRRLWAALRVSDRTGVALWCVSGMLTVSAQIALIASTRYLKVAIAVVIAAALPVIVIPVTVFVFGNRERVSLHTVAGTLLILVGVAGLLLR